MTREEAYKHSIIRIRSGSHLSGLNIETSDKDEIGVMIEPIEMNIGIGKPYEQFDEDNGLGDCTIYTLRKFLSLALKGNPTIIELLFAPESHWLGGYSVGKQLQELAPRIVSQRCGPAFLGYLEAQRRRLNGERGNGGHGKPRTELIDKFGYDTKFGMHMLRLGIQGKELLTRGKLTLPLPEDVRLFLLGVRKGAITLQACLERGKALEEEIKEILNSGTSVLPVAPESEYIEKWMIEVYWHVWHSRRIPLQDTKIETATSLLGPLRE